MRSVKTIVLVAAMIAAIFAAMPAAAGEYLGCGPADLDPSGYFRVEKADGRWWLVTPDGQRFISKGVNHVQRKGYPCPKRGAAPYLDAVTELYGDTAGWALATRERLAGWGFNTIGSWSDWRDFENMPYTVNLNLARLGGANWHSGNFIDVFDPDWERAAREYCREVCAPLSGDPWLVGYFLDNELHWGPDWRTLDSLLDEYLAMPESSPGGRRAREFLSSYSGGRKEAELDFAGIVAEEYFRVTGAALEAADPNHLNLGCRFHALSAPPGVLEAAGWHVDVLSVNMYDMMPRLAEAVIEALGNQVLASDWLAGCSELSGRPVMVTEFSYKANDAGLNNYMGAGPILPTQRGRAERFFSFAERCLESPHVVGYHWYAYMDIPCLGSNPGAAGNYGMVDSQDRPYLELTETMEKINNMDCELRGE